MAGREQRWAVVKERANSMNKAKLVGEKTYLRPLEREDIDNGWHDWINDPEINIHLINPCPKPGKA